jgi:hypothetical protein
MPGEVTDLVAGGDDLFTVDPNVIGVSSTVEGRQSGEAERIN